MRHVQAVFKLLRENMLHVKSEKCHLFKNQVDYCGFLIGGTGIRPIASAQEEIEKKIKQPR